MLHTHLWPDTATISDAGRLTIGIGRRGPITTAIQQAFFGLFNGETEDRWGWLEYV